MKEHNKKIYFLWSVVALVTMLCLLSFYRSYQDVQADFIKESWNLFQQEVQDDTDRRIRELGDAFCFSYSGASRQERDSLTIVTVDTIIHIKNNKERIRNEKIDFCSLFWYNICGDDKYEISV